MRYLAEHPRPESAARNPLTTVSGVPSYNMFSLFGRYEINERCRTAAASVGVGRQRCRSARSSIEELRPGDRRDRLAISLSLISYAEQANMLYDGTPDTVVSGLRARSRRGCSADTALERDIRLTAAEVVAEGFVSL